MTNDRNRLRENKDYDAFLSFHGVEFGLMEGTDGLLIVKTGSGGTIYGHENKYLTLAARIAESHNVSVIVSDNPLEIAPEENMSTTMSVAADYIASRNAGSAVLISACPKAASTVRCMAITTHSSESGCS
jgi:hypothetical protein